MAYSPKDNALGKTMSAVADAGVDDNTIMFFSSDNGPWLVHLENGGSAGLLRDGALDSRPHTSYLSPASTLIYYIYIYI